jgi:hypothetical protein
VDRGFCALASKQLFTAVHLFTASNVVEPLQILSVQPEKAQLLRSLSIEFDSKLGTDLIMRDVEMLSQALLSAPNLKDLRVRFSEIHSHLLGGLMKGIKYVHLSTNN